MHVNINTQINIYAIDWYFTNPLIIPLHCVQNCVKKLNILILYKEGKESVESQ